MVGGSRTVARNGSPCEPPTAKQLERMVAYVKSNGIEDVDADAILMQLQEWASLIRQARRPPTVSLDALDMEKDLTSLATEDPQVLLEEKETQEQQQQFLNHYHQTLLDCLDEAIALTITHRRNYLAKRKPPKDTAFAEGIYRFFVLGESMGAIAPHIGLKAQFQVTRLLQIRDLRAAICRHMQITLKQRIRQLAEKYVEVSELKQSLDQTLDDLLDRDIERIVAEAEAETFTAKSSNQSLLNQRFRHYLTHWSTLS